MSLLCSGCLLDIQGEVDDPWQDTGTLDDAFDTSGDMEDPGGDPDPDPDPDPGPDPDAEDTALDTMTDPVDTLETDTEPDMPLCDGPMLIFYIDRDGDGHGDIGGGVEWCSAPEGFVENHDDCIDTNHDVHPGQTEYFPTDRGDGSFDYDCDLFQTPLYTATTACHDWQCDGEGWYDTDGAPACGVTATWRHCYWEWFWCNIDEGDRVQLCR